MWEALIVSFIGLGLCFFVLVTEWFYRPNRGATWRFRDLPQSAVVIIMGVIVSFVVLGGMIYVFSIRLKGF